ncbi:MAG: helix-turn-helix domain-containing protein [Phycisphaerae bacterium]|nr:helix-turn-helix domain-containing protein [Phycisphaerae bacterium]
MELGEILRERRENLGLTQDKVAELAGISKPYLSNIETGRAKNPPTDGVLENLERALQLEPLQLMHLADFARTPPFVMNEYETRGVELTRLRKVVKEFITRGVAVDGQEIDIDQLADSIRPTDAVQDETYGTVIPIINKIAAGYPTEFTDLDYPPGIADEYLRIPTINDPQAFATYVSGDSMAPRYNDGDIVVFSPNTSPVSGDDCFVRLAEDRGTTFKRFYQDDNDTVRLQPINNAYPAQLYPQNDITGIWPAVYRVEKLRS